MDPVSCLPLAGDSKADLAIGSTLDPNLTPSPDRGWQCTSPL